MRVYHFLNREYGLEDIKRRHLKVSRIRDLNDPFEILSSSVADPDLRQAYRLIRESIDLRMGMICFSQSWSNPVQWSHYADRHRGLCLGFDLPDSLLQSVRCVSRRPVPNLDVLLEKPSKKAGQAELTSLLLTKFSHWRYEKEVRHIVPYGENIRPRSFYFQPFCEALALKEVIVGANSLVRRREIDRALGTLSDEVRAFKARLAFQSFRIVRQRDEALWI